MAQRQEMREGAFRNRLLDQVHDVVRLADGDIDAEHPKQLLILRVIDPGDGAPDLKLLLGDLADDEVVFILAGNGDDDISSPGAGRGEHAGFRRISLDEYR